MHGQSALVLDIGMSGAFVEHYGAAMSGDRLDLSFRWKGEEITFHCQVRRTKVIRAGGDEEHGNVSHTGMEFVDLDAASLSRLLDMMETFVERILAAQKANASADASQTGSILFQLGQARRSRTSGYVTYFWNGSSWTSAASNTPNQPVNGFTVAAHEDEEDLLLLCRTYETADVEGRNLIKLIAELSVHSARKA